MRAVKTFGECLREGIARKVSPDHERSKSLLAESERRMRSLSEKLIKLGVTDDNANDYIEYCYDLLMHAVRAALMVDGYNTAGQGAHESEVSYLRELGVADADVRFADQLRYYRNGILYYGTRLDAEYAKKVIAFAKRQQPKLIKLIQRKLS